MRIGYEEAIEMLPGVEARLAAAAEAYGETYEAALTALRKLEAVMAGAGAEVTALRQRAARLGAVIDRGPLGEPIEEATVDNPLITEGLASDGQGQRLIKVNRNMLLLIGGMARIADRSKEQTLAAAKFRSLHERAQLGGARAQDYTQLKVDDSGGDANRLAEIGDRARREYGEAVRVLGLMRSSVVERVVIYDGSLRELAASMGLTWSGGGKRRAKHALFEGINVLVDHFGLKAGAGAKPRHRAWVGERATRIETVREEA